MMVWASPSRTTSRPTMPESAPNCDRQIRWLSTSTWSLPGASSPCKNVRPSTGLVPRMSKYGALTRLSRSCRGSPRPVSVAVFPVVAAIAVNEVLCLCQS